MKVHRDNTYTVEYDEDGEVEEDVPEDCMRVDAERERDGSGRYVDADGTGTGRLTGGKSAPLREGDRVEVHEAPEQRDGARNDGWKLGEVLRAHTDGSVDVVMDDGRTLREVPTDTTAGTNTTRLVARRARRKRSRSWDCLEAMAVANHTRHGAVGRRPNVKQLMVERDEIRRAEKLLSLYEGVNG